MLIDLMTTLRAGETLGRRMIALVSDNKDEKDLNRIKVKIPGVYETDDVKKLPRVYPMKAADQGSRGDASSAGTPEPGTVVQVTFPTGDPHYAQYEGAPHTPQASQKVFKDNNVPSAAGSEMSIPSLGGIASAVSGAVQGNVAGAVSGLMGGALGGSLQGAVASAASGLTGQLRGETNAAVSGLVTQVLPGALAGSLGGSVQPGIRTSVSETLTGLFVNSPYPVAPAVMNAAAGGLAVTAGDVLRAQIAEVLSGAESVLGGLIFDAVESVIPSGFSGPLTPALQGVLVAALVDALEVPVAEIVGELLNDVATGGSMGGFGGAMTGALSGALGSGIGSSLGAIDMGQSKSNMLFGRVWSSLQNKMMSWTRQDKNQGTTEEYHGGRLMRTDASGNTQWNIPGNLDIRAKGRISIYGEKIIHIRSKEEMYFSADKDIVFKSDKDFTVESKGQELKSEKFGIKTGEPPKCQPPFITGELGIVNAKSQALNSQNSTLDKRVKDLDEKLDAMKKDADQMNKDGDAERKRLSGLADQLRGDRVG